MKRLIVTGVVIFAVAAVAVVFYFFPLMAVGFRTNFVSVPRNTFAPLPNQNFAIESSGGLAAFYFSGDQLFLPFILPAHKAGAFERMRISLDFDRPQVGDTRIGIKHFLDNEFIVKPLYYAALDSLDWNVIHEGGAYLYQKNADFKSVTDFLAHPPMDKKVATYFYDPSVGIDVQKFTENPNVPDERAQDAPFENITSVPPADLELFDFVLTTYGGAVGGFDINLRDVLNDDDKATILIESPGLRASGQRIRLRSLDMKLIPRK